MSFGESSKIEDLLYIHGKLCLRYGGRRKDRFGKKDVSILEALKCPYSLHGLE